LGHSGCVGGTCLAAPLGTSCGHPAPFARVHDMLVFHLQTVALPQEAQQRYVRYLRQHIFGQAPLPPDFQELLSSLDAQSQAPQRQSGVRRQSAGVATPSQRSRLGGSQAAGGGEQPDAAEPAGDGAASSAAAAAASKEAKAASGATGTSAAPAGTAAAAGDVGGGVGSGAAAGSNITAAVTYTSTMNVKGELAGHPDYLAVLTAVAAYGWITPKFMHRLVVALERDMVETEVALAVQQRP